MEVRFIFRNLMTEDKLDLLTAQGFPKDAIRFQEGCHNKTIIVDDKVGDGRQPQLVERGRRGQP